MHAQQILGDAMRVVHDYSIISADLVQQKAPGKTILDPVLLDEFEQLRVALQPKSLEEISKIWTALPRVNFRRSVTYEVSVVQIASQQARSSGLPVRERRVHAVTMRSPHIDEAFRQPPLLGTKIAAVEEGETLRLAGYNLQAPNTTVMMDGALATIGNLQSNQIDVIVPADQLSIGIHTVLVAQNLILSVLDGQPPEARGGFTSNSVGFQLLPKITGPAIVSAAGVVTVPVQPAVKASQERTLLLGDTEVPGVAVAPGSLPANNVAFQLPRPPNDPLPGGIHLMRVRIDGAESRPQVDSNPNSSTYLQYVGPTVTV
jgi:hypothetical protein